MDVLSVIQMAIVAAIVGSSTTFIHIMMQIIAVVLAYVLHVNEEHKVTAIDYELGKHGICSCRIAGPNNLPSNGIHFIYLSGPIIAIRSTMARGNHGENVTSYMLYILGAAAFKKIDKLINGDSQNITLCYIDSMVPWNVQKTTTRVSAIEGNPYDWQTPIINDINTDYRTKKRASIVMSGPPGCGKSMLAEFLAVEMRKLFNVDPIVIKNFNPMTKGVSLNIVLGYPTEDNPVIIVIDEFDRIVDFAETKRDEKTDSSAIASNRQTLLGCLDRLNRTSFVVTIATTNKPLESFNTDEKSAYIRTGRIDHHYTV